MIDRSTVAVAIRWFIYGALVGVVIDAAKVGATKTWQGWQNAAGPLLTTVIEFAVVGLLIGVFRHHLAKRKP
jgi:hypothetical protein